MAKSQPKLAAVTHHVIEKGVPLPASVTAKKYPFSEMEVGDSLFLPGENSAGNVAAYARSYGQRSGWKYSARNVEGGLRIWRVE